MGLAFESISQFKAPPIIQTLISERVLSSAMFGLKLGPSGSELTIGGLDPHFKEGDFTWLKLSTGVCQASKCV
jgi:cathepsin D